VRQFFLTLLTVLPLIGGCMSTAFTPSSELVARPPGVNDIEFVALADAEVKKLFPEWYLEEVIKLINIVPNGRLFATIGQRPDGIFVIILYPKALALDTLGDLTSILFHEYVHAKIWNRLQETIPDLTCNAAIHELTAYGAELEQDKIKVTSAFRTNTRLGYRLSYLKAGIYCSDEAFKDFPEPGIY